MAASTVCLRASANAGDAHAGTAYNEAVTCGCDGSSRLSKVVASAATPAPSEWPTHFTLIPAFLSLATAEAAPQSYKIARAARALIVAGAEVVGLLALVVGGAHRELHERRDRRLAEEAGRLVRVVRRPLLGVGEVVGVDEQQRADGGAVGTADGGTVGAADGGAVGAGDGGAVGVAVGVADGTPDGSGVGAIDGGAVGGAVGSTVVERSTRPPAASASSSSLSDSLSDVDLADCSASTNKTGR